MVAASGAPTSPADAAQAVRAVAPEPLDVAVVTGSGLSALGDALEGPRRIPYADLPGWPRPTVPGHAGQLVLGELSGLRVAVAAGRVHLYEGHPPAALAFGVRVLAALGARVLVTTNAAGGLNPGFRPGDVMVIRDHLFLPGLAGASPLVGPNDDDVGPRFPAMSDAYDAALAAAALAALPPAGLVARQGIYAMVAGPTYETPAEARFLRLAGADAVGMSTVPEVVAARHAGLRVVGLSLITNVVRLEPGTRLAAGLHQEVTAVAGAAAGSLAAAVAAIVAAARD